MAKKQTPPPEPQPEPKKEVPEGSGMQVMTPPVEKTEWKRIAVLVTLGVVTIAALVIVLLVLTRPDTKEEDINALLEGIPVVEEVDEDDAMMEGSFASMLFTEEGYPQGVAEVEGYYTEVEVALDLDAEGETTTCAAFMVTDGPDWVLDAYTDDATSVHYDRTFVVSELGDRLGQIWTGSPHMSDASEENPIRAVFRIGTVVESAVVGCEDTVALIGTVPL